MVYSWESYRKNKKSGFFLRHSVCRIVCHGVSLRTKRRLACLFVSFDNQMKIHFR